MLFLKRLQQLDNVIVRPRVTTILSLFRVYPHVDQKLKNVKVSAIGQSLIQIARPSTILCKCGSEFVVELLHAFGFGSSIMKALNSKNLRVATSPHHKYQICVKFLIFHYIQMTIKIYSN